MYSWRYGRRTPRRYNYSSRYYPSSYNRYSRRYPWYGPSRWRSRAYDRDRAFWVSLNDDSDDDRYPRARRPEIVEVNEPEVLPTEKPKKLKVKEIDLHIKDNSEAHKTDDYECNLEDRVRVKPDGKKEYLKPELVIRRGQEFKMTITFDGPYDVKKNDISMTFNLGDDYKPNKNLSATFFVKEPGESASYKPKRWGASVVGQEGNSLTVNIFVPATTCIGEWEFSITSIVDDEDHKEQYNHNEDINIIFNPWCKEDTVYMSDEKWLAEAVLNDEGALYRGNWRRIGACPWNFEQFDDGILEAAFHLVRKAFDFRASPMMANATKVARLISQIVNSQDDQGVLAGKWNGGYGGGTKPTDWMGSAKILLQYMETKRPVKYGQCWVFSAVVTTVCRALGIPCRSVTNFASAHNTDDNLTIDYEVVNGKTVSKDGDSIWNFHVWNEVWMSRLDLDEDGKWDGWQVIDATPQETSEGVYCCGPAPVKAIKEGEIAVGKDTPFIFAEVNADKAIWEWSRRRNKDVIGKRLKDAVGKYISTHEPTGKGYGKATGSGPMERLDLTGDYKYQEGSSEERKIVKKAERKMKLLSSGSADLSDSEEEEFVEKVEIEIEDPGDLYVGSSFTFVVNVKNITDSPVVVKDVVLKVTYMTYTGSNTQTAASMRDEDIQLRPGQIHTMRLFMSERITLMRPEDSFIFDLTATASFEDTSHCVVEDFNFRLRRPDIVLKGPETCRRFTDVDVDASFTNPLNVPLTNCEIELGGAFYCKVPRRQRFDIRDIRPGGTWNETFTVTPKPFPRRKKDRKLTVAFHSRQLDEINGSITMVMQF